MTEDVIEYTRAKFYDTYPEYDFEEYLDEYLKLKPFKISENVEIVGGISPQAHFIMKTMTQYYIEHAFAAMKIDMSDPNVVADPLTGNIGTPGRVAKTWTGADLEDTSELLSGRWTKEPRMASFRSNEAKNPVFVETSLDAVCSHHLIRFGDDNHDQDSFVVVGYFPEDEFGGISKINRYVRWCAARGWLQESLTNYIGEKIKEKFKTESVYVGIFNAKHGCASFRGALDRNACTSTVYISGKFKENMDLIPQKYRG